MGQTAVVSIELIFPNNHLAFEMGIAFILDFVLSLLLCLLLQVVLTEIF